MNNLQLVRPGLDKNGLFFGTPRVPMMLLTVMMDCSPVIALCPPWYTATWPPDSQRTSLQA
jgi:hypothetical protein